MAGDGAGERETDLRTGTGDALVTMPEAPGEVLVVTAAAPPPFPGINETLPLPPPPLQQHKEGQLLLWKLARAPCMLMWGETFGQSTGLYMGWIDT